MNYQEWEEQVPDAYRKDSLWSLTAYRLALFLGDLAWEDCTKLMQDRRTLSTADQLFRSAGGVSSQIAEGYSRTGGKDRARFYEYALGSARESREWYFKSRHVLGASVFEHRVQVLTEIIRITITMIAQQRDGTRSRLN